jgi:hypothetical protein
MILLNILFVLIMGQSATGVAAILTNYLNNFKLTFDLELAKNTPEDLMLHFITPVIPNFKNEILEKSYFILSKDPVQYSFIEFSGAFTTINSISSLPACNSNQTTFTCILLTLDETKFNFNKERLVLFGSVNSFNLIDSLSNFKYDLYDRFSSNNINLIQVNSYWLENSNKFNDYKHDIDLDVYMVFKFKNKEQLYYSNSKCNFYPHSYWDPDYLIYDQNNNFISGLYPIKYRHNLITNFEAIINKTDRITLSYGLNSTTVKLKWLLENDYNFCNINYFVISYSNDYDNDLYSKHYSRINIYNDTSMMIDTCSTDYNFNYDFFKQTCNDIRGDLNVNNKPINCNFKSSLKCNLINLNKQIECSIILNNISFASKFRFYVKAISKINQDLWNIQGASVFSDITVPYSPINIKTNIVKTVDEIPIINLLVPNFNQMNGDIKKVFVFLINHGSDVTFSLIQDMYPRLFDPRNQNDLKDFIQNINKNPVCAFDSPLNEFCRLDFNTYVRNKNYLITNLITDQIRKDFSESIITQCSFIQKKSSYQILFLFEIDYLVGRYNSADGSTKIDYTNKIYFAANPLEPINPSININNINNLIMDEKNKPWTRNNGQKNDGCSRNGLNSSSIAALATFLTFSLIANIGLTIYIFRKNIKIFYENIIYLI